MRAIYLDSKTDIETTGPATPGLIKPGEEPHVTVVICAYNEGAVVPKTIAMACCIAWPKEKLTVHVCDDSIDKISIELINKEVDYWKRQGVDVARLSRPDRVGYKAGNLRCHFSRHRGDYLAYFDADHHADADFLRKMIPFFFDKDGASLDKIGLVQAPCAYHNTHESFLSECGRWKFACFCHPLALSSHCLCLLTFPILVCYRRP
jgi:cellulose synthase/poly-beta-1,6-N-acetylglucosamine synthase-like glycosyltransferase